MSPLRVQLKEFWRRLSLPDLLAAGMVLVGASLLVLGKSGVIFSFLKYIALLCAVYLAVRFIGWWRSRLLWSLRNRLIVAYLFIALVPVFLTMFLPFLSATFLTANLVATSSIKICSVEWTWWLPEPIRLRRHWRAPLPRCRKRQWTA